MGFIAVKCPNCGAEVNLDESREFGFCTYCGTKVVQEKIVVEHRGQVSVDGVSTLNSILDRANIYLEQSDFEHAKDYYNKALDIQPRCSKAYWGLLLCKEQVQNNNQLISKIRFGANHFLQKLESIPEYKNALKYASPSERQEYLAIVQRLEAEREQERQVNEEAKKEMKVVGIICACLIFIVVLILKIVSH